MTLYILVFIYSSIGIITVLYFNLKSISIGLIFGVLAVLLSVLTDELIYIYREYRYRKRILR